MIADFIESNKLDARLISFKSDTTLEKACSDSTISVSCAAKVLPFVDEKMDFFVVILPAGESIPASEANSLFKKNDLSEADAADVNKLTGFHKDFFPPICVFGAKVAFHKSLASKRHLFFPIGEREFLLISKKSIEDAAEISEFWA